MEQGVPGHTSDRSARVARLIALVAVVAGGALRIIEFLRDRPLWLDEAMLALSIATRSVGGLLRPLDYDQSAPLLYLWGERLAVALGGVNERMLRLLPFLAGLALLLGMWIVGRRLVAPVAAAVATLLAAVSVTLLGFSAEAKQYGVDPAATLLALWVAAGVRAAPDDPRRWRWLAAGGVTCLLLSHPAVFTLGAVTVALALDPRVRGAGRARARLALTAGAWTAAFVVLYAAIYRATAASAYMQRFWEGTFLDPAAPDIVLRLRMFAIAAFTAPTLSASPEVPPVALAVAWLAALGLAWRRDRSVAVALGGPMVLAAAASAIGMYPVMDRLLLFAAPLTLLAYGGLVARAVELAPAPRRALALVAACGAILVSVAGTHWERIARPVFFGVGRQIVADVDGMSRGEPVYVAARSLPLWLFYTTDWRSPDLSRVRWAASIARAGGPAHNNAPPRGRVRPGDADSLVRRYRGRVEIIGVPTGREFVASSRTLNPRLSPAEYALPLEPDTGWAEQEVQRMAAVAHPRVWVFGSHMFALDSAEPALVAELQRRGVRLVMERRQGTTVAYHVEFPAEP